MHRIDNSTAVAVMPTRQPTGTVGFFSQGSQTTGQLATIVGPDILNAIMMEIANVITNAGIALSKTNDAQLWQAINALINAARLGFTPVQQGGGAGQGTNKVYIGWSVSGLKAHVDATDQGTFVFPTNSYTWTQPQYHAGPIVLNHLVPLNVTDAAGTVTPALMRADDYLEVWCSPIGFRVVDHTASYANLIVDNAGNVTVRGALSATGVSATSVNSSGGIHAVTDIGADRDLFAARNLQVGVNATAQGLVTAGGFHSTGDLNVDGNQHTNGTIGCDGDISAGTTSTVHCNNVNASGGGYFAQALTGNQNVNAGLDVVVVSGTGRKPGGGAWDVPSDQRLKQNLAAYAGGLDIIRQLNPVTFNYLPATGFDPEVRHVGLIAQEVEDVMPNAVKTLAVETMPEATAAWHPESVTTFYADLGEVRVTNTNEALFAMLNAIKELDARMTAAGI